MRTMLKSKIHRARVTEVNLDYEGSITIDRTLLETADILPFERVEVLNINNGARFSTYAIEGEVRSGVIGINGAAARLVAKGDIVIILSYCQIPDNEAMTMIPTMVYVDNKNRILEPSTLRASLGWEVILSGEGLEDKGVTKCGLQSRR
ncbi:MAG: aspartate 1-decarboxylase [Chloroflexi bacterium CG08_land_8_20_14_0_20_45_12]|nr:MAG: aspartate 1-decarboxylase [Chloroflexi bacterium CG08_land_8_20_14_0_20_45_12]